MTTPLELSGHGKPQVPTVSIPGSLLQVIKTCRTLPSIPGVALEVLELSQDPDIGTAKIAKVVARDPALVAKILKVANSVWCGVRREVTTLNQAVNLLGVNGTMSLALSFSLIRGLRKNTVSEFDHQRYWRRSVISATATLSLGICSKAENQDEFFLVGLLQDIGMLVLNEALPEYGRLVASSRNDHGTLIELEQEELETDHSQIGAWFLSKWGLPFRLTDAVGGSHQTEPKGDLLKSSAAIGSCIAEIWINPNTAGSTARAAEAARIQLGQASDQFSLILAKTAADLPQITRNLDIAVGNETFINGLLDQAREAITELNVRAMQETKHFAMQAQRDSLTSLYNRAYLDQVLNDRFETSKNSAHPMTVIFIDIDMFKNVNDTYGHHSGDGVLQSVAKVIQSSVRDYDTVARYGGDEFVVLITNSTEQSGADIAERIRAAVERQPHRTSDGKKIRVTVSVGWAALSSESELASVKEILESADRSLYAAKNAGRNRVAQAV